MSFFASVLRAAYKLSGAKKAFTLPEDEILKVIIEKQNRSRGVFTPKDHKAHYEMITVNGFPCLIVRERPQPSKRAIYSADEVLYGALPDFEEACRRANVPYTAFSGRELKDFPLTQLYDQVAFVSQDNYLFDESVRENIRMGRMSATDAEVEAAARAAGCAGFIDEL